MKPENKLLLPFYPQSGLSDRFFFSTLKAIHFIFGWFLLQRQIQGFADAYAAIKKKCEMFLNAFRGILCYCRYAFYSFL